MDRGILSGAIAMAVIVILANVLVQFLAGDWLTWGGLIYPLTFLVTDLMNRLYGTRAARHVVYYGFAAGIGCSLIGTQIVGDGGPLVTLRIAVGSGTAYLVAQLADVQVFDRLRAGRWWQAPLVSTVVGSTLDTAIFYVVAFSASLAFIEPANDVSWVGSMLPLLGQGPVVPFWVSLGVADLMLKISVSIVLLLPFRVLVLRLSQPAIA